MASSGALPMDMGLVGFIFTVLIALVLFFKSIVLVRPFEKGVVERFGKYDRIVGAGVTFIAPFAENVYKVDMREAMIDVPAQDVITNDNVNISIDAVIYFKVVDPFKVMYNVAMFEDAIGKLAQTNIRNILGSTKLDDTLGSRDKINVDLRKTLDEITDRWGVHVTRVEIQDIKPPQDIVDAMSRQMKAERMKRAAILEAEGFKAAEVLKAEGRRAVDILEAEGQAKAIESLAEAERKKKSLIAEGEANAIERVFSAIHEGRPTKDILTIKYLETLGKMADGQATKIFMPFEASGVLGGAAMIGDMLKEGGSIKKLVSRVNKSKVKSSLASAGDDAVSGKSGDNKD